MTFAKLSQQFAERHFLALTSPTSWISCCLYVTLHSFESRSLIYSYVVILHTVLILSSSSIVEVARGYCYCPHCKESVSLSAYRRHMRRYNQKKRDQAGTIVNEETTTSDTESESSGNCPGKI